MDKNIEVLRKLYLIPNDFQIWAWILTVMAVLFCFKGTRRFGGMGFGVIVVCMGIFFGLRKAMSDFAPSDIPKATPTPQGRRRMH